MRLEHPTGWIRAHYKSYYYYFLLLLVSLPSGVGFEKNRRFTTQCFAISMVIFKKLEINRPSGTKEVYEKNDYTFGMTSMTKKK